MITKQINLYPQQYDFVECNENLTGFVAGIGSGKTFAGALKACIYSSKPSLGMIVAPTYGMLRDSTLRTFEEIAGVAIVGRLEKQMTLYMRGGGEIMLRSADNPEKLRGPNLNWVWIDEGGLTKRITWEICIGRIRADGKFGSIWVTTTPKGKRNWVYEATQKNMRVFKATTLDNPYTSAEWKEMLRTSYSGQFYEQEVNAEFVSYEGLVYPMFDANKHVRRVDTSNWTGFGLGVDDGYTNPAVCLKIYESADGDYHVKEEWYQRGKLQSEIADEVYRMADQHNPDIAIDSSAASLKAALKDKGLMVDGATSSVLAGIKTIQDLLAHDKISIDPSCVNHINEYESYVWKPDKDEPEKQFDHSLDAFRYFVTRKRAKALVAEQRRY